MSLPSNEGLTLSASSLAARKNKARCADVAAESLADSSGEYSLREELLRNPSAFSCEIEYEDIPDGLRFVKSTFKRMASA
jgi:hypothetical protein